MYLEHMSRHPLKLKKCHLFFLMWSFSKLWFWNLFVTFPVLCNIWFLCEHVPFLNRKKTWTSRSILGVLWGMLEREMYIVVPNYSKAWQKVLLFESSPKTNIYKYWLSRTKTYHEAYEHTYFLCFGDTCSVHKHQISTSMSWSIDILRSCR